MANYYDSVLDSFGEGIFSDSYGEGILGDSYGEGILGDSYGEASDNKRRPIKVPTSLGKPSNFGNRIPPSPSPSGNFATKAELKSSLNSISDQVNDLKKSSINIATSLKRLDDGYEKIVKSIAKKSQSQDAVISSTPMMTLLGTIINKPTLNPAAITIVPGATPDAPDTITATPDAIQVDLTKTFLFAMMPMMMSGGGTGGDNSSMMMMMMVLLLGSGTSGSSGGSALGSGSDGTLVLLMMMMMMMNKK